MAVDATQGTTETLERLLFQVVTNGTNSALYRSNIFTVHVMIEEFNRCSTKEELGGIDRNGIFLETSKDEAEMPMMFVLFCTSNENIISVQKNETETTKHLVPEPLECMSCILQAKRH